MEDSMTVVPNVEQTDGFVAYKKEEVVSQTRTFKPAEMILMDPAEAMQCDSCQ